jgi:hypothetical protein
MQNSTRKLLVLYEHPENIFLSEEKVLSRVTD